MEPLPFRTILDPAAMALSDSSSGEQEDTSASIFTTECPSDYCSRTNIQLSFSSVSSRIDPKRMAHLLRSACMDVLRDRYLKESEMIQRYILSDNLLEPHDKEAETASEMVPEMSLSNIVPAADVNANNEACSGGYTQADLMLIVRSIQEGLMMYVSVAGAAFYSRPYSSTLDDLFHIAQFPLKSANTYIERQMQDNKSAVRAIIADIYAYRRALLDCYKHISKTPFAIVLGSSFEALFGRCIPPEKGNFCMVSGYPGVIETLEHTLRTQSKAGQKLKGTKSTHHLPYNTYREGSSIYVCGDITPVTNFFLYTIPLGIGLHSAEKSLPQIYSTHPFECSYQSTSVAYAVDEDSALLSVDCYMPFFSVKKVLDGLHRAMANVSKDCQMLVELSTPTQHSRSFNTLDTYCTNEIPTGPVPKSSTPGTHSFLTRLCIDAKGFTAYY